MLTEHFCWFILPLQLVPPHLSHSVSLCPCGAHRSLSSSSYRMTLCVYSVLWCTVKPASHWHIYPLFYTLLTTKNNRENNDTSYNLRAALAFSSVWISSDNDQNVITVVFLHHTSANNGALCWHKGGQKETQDREYWNKPSQTNCEKILEHTQTLRGDCVFIHSTAHLLGLNNIFSNDHYILFYFMHSACWILEAHV